MENGEAPELGSRTHRSRELRLRIETDDPLYQGLKKLKICGKELDPLPPDLFQMIELEVLDLSPEREACIYYRLPDVPPEIGNLANLRVLLLDTNELTHLPEAIFELPLLERLSLSNNNLNSISESIGKARSLTSLHLVNNRLEQLPQSICSLNALRYLDVSANYLESLPDQIGTDLPNLECLILIYNKIRRLPESICNLQNLRMLWIGNNQIRRLPERFGELEKLDWGERYTSSLAFEGNPLEHPPVGICRRGMKAIRIYLQKSYSFASETEYSESVSLPASATTVN